MFALKQPDYSSLRIAEQVAQTADHVKTYLVDSVKYGLRVLFYAENPDPSAPLVPRTIAEVESILAAFENPAEVFQRHTATVQYMLSQYPDCMVPADYVPPYTVTIDPETGGVTLSEIPVEE